MSVDRGSWESGRGTLAEIHQPPVNQEGIATAGGKVKEIDVVRGGQATLQPGAAHAKAGDGDYFPVGFGQFVKAGEAIHAHQPVCRIPAHPAADRDRVEALMEKAVKISPID